MIMKLLIAILFLMWTRVEERNLAKEQGKKVVRKYSFTRRHVNEWNITSADCVRASSVNMSKKIIGRRLIR